MTEKRFEIAPALACAALFLAAPVFALLTWQTEYTFLMSRHLSIPIMAAEAVVVVVGIIGGFRLVPALAGLHPITRFASLSWVVAALVSALLAEAMPSMAMALCLSSLLNGLFLLVCWHMASGAWVNWRVGILTSVAAGAALYFLIILLLAKSQIGNPEFNWGNFGPGVSNVRQLGYYGLALAGISAGFLATTSPRHIRPVWMLALTLGLWLTYLSGSRAAFGAILFALGVLVTNAPKAHRPGYFATIVICALVAAFLSYIFVPDPIWGLDRILGRVFSTDPSTDFSSGRMEIWTETVRSLGDHPFFGHGEGQFRFIVQTSLGIYNHPHNSLLQFLFQWGLVGTTALSVIVMRTVKLLPARIATVHDYTFPALGAMSALVTMSLLDGALYYVYPTMIVLLCAGIISSNDRDFSSASEPKRRSSADRKLEQADG